MDEIFLPNRDIAELKTEIPLPEPKPVVLNDRVIRMIGIPFFGIAVPNVAGLIHNHLYDVATLVCAYAWFIFIAFAIWQGNRYLLFRLRNRFTWMHRPVLKICALVLSNVLYTLPLCWVLMTGWYRLLADEEIDYQAIALASAACVICVIFITHIYEFVFLANESEHDRAYREKLQVTLNKVLVIRQAQPVALEAPSFRERLLLKKGNDLVPVKTNDIACFYTLEKIVFAVDREGGTYMADESLTELEKQLSPKSFMRANRQFLVHIDAVSSFRPHGKGKLSLSVKAKVPEDIVVSQEQASAFRSWLGQ